MKTEVESEVESQVESKVVSKVESSKVENEVETVIEDRWVRRVHERNVQLFLCTWPSLIKCYDNDIIANLIQLFVHLKPM